jgi:hypothetical protein
MANTTTKDHLPHTVERSVYTKKTSNSNSLNKKTQQTVLQKQKAKTEPVNERIQKSITANHHAKKKLPHFLTIDILYIKKHPRKEKNRRLARQLRNRTQLEDMSKGAQHDSHQIPYPWRQ